MASRRMVSNKIIDSARFIKMPISSQALYFHLIAKGDDDGVVEAFNVMRMIGATEDDLKVLVSKGFVVVLNEDLVSYIADWKEHNLIRADRKIDSIYKDLLLQIVPDAELLEKKTSYYQRKKELAGICLTNDSIGKDSIGKNNIINSPAKAEPISVEEVINYMNNCGEINDYFKVKKKFSFRSNASSNKKVIKARINEGYTLDDFKDVIFNAYDKFIEHEYPGLNGKPSIQYYNPNTIFTSSKMEKYKNEYENM